jgi:hypothetical protein
LPYVTKAKTVAMNRNKKGIGFIHLLAASMKDTSVSAS